MTSLDDWGAFNAAWWPNVLKGLKDAECPRNLCYLSQGYFSQRTAVMSNNNINIERRVTKGCPQGSCCGPTFWNLLYNSIFNPAFANLTKVIAFADDLTILTKEESIVEAESYTNLELKKIWLGTKQQINVQWEQIKSNAYVPQEKKREKRKWRYT